MRNLKLILMTLILSLIVVSCGDSNEPTDNGFTMTQDSYWIMQNYETNEAGELEETDIDSSYFGSPMIIENKKWNTYISTKSGVALKSDTSFFRTDDDMVFMLYDFGAESMLGSELKSEVLVADWDATHSWIATEIDTTIAVNYNDNNIEADIEITVQVAPGKNTTITVAGKKYDVKEFVVTTEVEVDAAIIISSISIEFEAVQRYFVSKDNFILQSKEDEYLTKVNFLGQKQDFTTPAAESRCIRFDVK